MRFLADESCDFAVVRALRASGHDVIAVAEIAARTEDAEVIAWAVREARVVLTEDKDFGQLVYAGAHQSTGVVLIRFPPSARPILPSRVLDMIRQNEAHLARSFVVVQPHRVRVRPRQEAPEP
jgi:predicted nuclease of predicted toxin-antitoxin system